MNGGTDWTIDVDRVYDQHPFAKTILETLDEAGHEAVLVGGVVRDGLRAQFDPDYAFRPQEVDIATSAHTDEIEGIFDGYKVLNVGREFGVQVIVSPDGEPYEVATYRVEDEYDGRWPGRVELVRDLKRDLARRDFTINGLAARSDGTVVDWVGGIEDLRTRTIRPIGDANARLQEDYLRMLRAVRFACVVDATLTSDTREAIRAHADRIATISWERIRDELIAMLRTPRSRDGVDLMNDLGLLGPILPELVHCQEVPQPEVYHPEGDVYVHTLLALEIADRVASDPILKLAVLLHDVGKPEALERNDGENMAGHDEIGAHMAREACGRLRLSNAETDRVVNWVAEHQRIGHFPDMGQGKQVKLLKTVEEADVPIAQPLERYPRFAGLLRLMIVDCQASAMKSAGWLPVLSTFARLLLHMEALDRRMRARKLIDGHDLIELGLEPGPQIGAILERLYEKIYAGELISREAALEEAKRLMGEQAGE